MFPCVNKRQRGPKRSLAGSSRGPSLELPPLLEAFDVCGASPGPAVKGQTNNYTGSRLCSSLCQRHGDRAVADHHRRQLKGLWKRLHGLQNMDLTRDEFLLKLGAAKTQFPTACRVVNVVLPKTSQQRAWPNFWLRRDKLWPMRKREGRCLLHSNMSAENPAER